MAIRDKNYSMLYYNKGNDCDNCKNQYRCGVDGDAIGCLCRDNGKECNYVACTEAMDKETLINPFALFDERKCRICGCTWNSPCEGGCYWVEYDLCSKCAEATK